MDINAGLDLVRKLKSYEVFILLGLAVAVLLFGYRIKKIAFFIAWFILGFLLMQYFLPTLNGWVPEIASNNIYQTLLPFGGGAIMALLGFSIEKFCVGGICFGLVMLMTVTEFGTEVKTLAIGAVVGVIAAGAAVALMKPATIVVTAILGAYAITLSLLVLISDIDPAVFYWPMLIGLSAVGTVFQFLTTRKTS